MIAFCIRWAVKFLALAALTYVVCFVKIGRFTTLEHVRKISATSEAREFGTEVAGVVDRAKAKAIESVGNPPPAANPR